MQTEGLSEYPAIVAKEPEEKATTEMMILACVTGSVLISKTNFMSRARARTEGRRKRTRRRVLDTALE